MFSAYSEDDGLASAKVVKELRPFPRSLEIIEVSSTHLTCDKNKRRMENHLNGMKTQIRSFNNSRKAFRKKQCMGILNTRILNLLLWILTLVPPTRL